MAFNYSKGPQVIGDLKAADDAQRDTKIDFGEDYIGLETSGAVRMVISGSDGKVGIGVASPNYKLDIQGDIRVRGNDIRDSSGDKAISFDGLANTTVSGSLTISGSARNYTFPATDGNANQVLQTNGNGQLTFVDVDDGEGGGGGGGPQTPEVLRVGFSGSTSEHLLLQDHTSPAQYQKIQFNKVFFDTFSGSAGYQTGSSEFVAGEEGYYELNASAVVNKIQHNTTQFQFIIACSSAFGTHSMASNVMPFIALAQYHPLETDTDGNEVRQRTFHLSVIERFAVNQSASVQIRMIGGSDNETEVMRGHNKTFFTVKKL